jgi:hypothetical protein
LHDWGRTRHSLTLDECSAWPIQASEEANQASDEGKVDEHMRKFQIGAVLFAVLAFSAIAVASASATEFLVSGVTATAGTILLSESIGAGLLLEDMKGSLTGGAASVLCSGFNLAEILSATDLDVISIFGLTQTDPGTGSTTIKCTNESNCPEPSEVKALNLPWLVELSLEGTTILAHLGTGGAGAPGWEVTCFGVKDTCTGEAFVEFANVESMVNATFGALSNSTPATCSRGGVKEGLVEGTVLFETETGLALAIS